ncbi:protein phosphatase 1 regulatory subunit 26 [Eublepharis macularius]|uniref:Protein phosphatase 1 regulatory subunit 26 n=1 Tax=Eublepharis macularius TaxID=481883 RepID=A0AA97KEH7_EUBMA|nr:protein phosphatase 1 regulatory subunit 26 [Eublepharis macularius]
MCRPSHSSARMFLMNTSPLVALQRKWEPFAQARSCRYPVCFSESEDDIARTSVSTKVQMIIKNLQSEESSLGTTNEYGCILQKKRKGAKIRGHRLRGNGRIPLQERAKYAQRSCPADSDGMEVEESSEFGPSSLNSDSDDSVDREIEEAIQEYLKNKGQSIPPLPSNTKSLRSTNTHKSFIKEHPSYDVACNVFPASVNSNLIPQHLAPDFLGDDALQWAPSPCSVSSDDSFEQSIKAEIEQFLNEKKQQARKKSVSVGSKSLDQKEAQEKLAIKSQKNGSSKASPSSLKCKGKAFFLRRHPELQNTTPPPKCLMVKTEEFMDFKKTSQKHFKASGASHSCILEQSNNGDIGQKFWKARGEQSAESVDLSDSSSDDGIEEAIQLYQLEKVRKAANVRAGCVPSQKDRGLADISASLTIHSEKSALPENSRTTLSNKRKEIGSKSTELNKIGVICHEIEKGRCCTSANNFTSYAVTLQTCRADTAAELMCAEAILDISKTILPPPAANDSRSLLTYPLSPSQSIPSSHQESDSNAVDSDDSIEQEIRAFLAIKAQTERLITKSDEALNAAPNPLSSGQPCDQNRSPKRSFPNTLKLSLGQKRKLKKEGYVSRQKQDKQTTQLEMDYNYLGNDNYSKPFASQEENILSSVKNSETGGATMKEEVAPATVSSVDFANPPPRLLGTGGLVRNTRQALQKYVTDDKSSSLDSDEDLDTAIKDLLRSKRKLKKKPKDQKIQCKKKVRFGNAEMHIFEDKLEVLQEKDCKSKNSTLLKSCLLRSRRNMMEESPQGESQYAVKGRSRNAEAFQLALMFGKGCRPFSEPDSQAAAINDQHPWIATPLIEDSSSLDSDDSIEQEIQRFLAEKAKDSSSTVHIASALGIVDTLKAAQPQTAQSKAKRQQLEGEDVALSKHSKRAKKARQPRTTLRSPLRTEREGAGNVSQIGEPAITCMEDICTQVTGKCQRNQGTEQAKGASLSVKRTAVERKGVSGGKLDQKRLSSWKEKAENCKLQNYFKRMSAFKRKSPYEFKISSKFITGFRSAQKKKKSVLFRKKPSIEFSVLQSNVFRRQEGLLGERCEAPAQTGILGSKSEVKEADLDVQCIAEGLYPPVSEKTEVIPLSIAVVSFAKAKLVGDAEPCSSADSKHSRFLQEPSADVAREVNVISTPLEVSLMEKEGKVQHHSNNWEEFRGPQSCNLPLKESVSLIQQDRIAETQTQKALEEGSKMYRYTCSGTN